MTNRQSIILRYENVVTKVTFLKAIDAEMNAPVPILNLIFVFVLD